MIRRLVVPFATSAVVFAVIISLVRFAHAQAGPERKFLIEEDLEIPGYQILVTTATLGVGEREGRHTHPGTLVGYLLEGQLTLERDGQPPVALKPGDSILVKPGQIHEGINTGSVPTKALAMFVVEKDKPLSTPANLAGR